MANTFYSYGASQNLSVSGLNGCPTNSAWTQGWGSAAIVNSSGYLDYLISARLTLATGMVAGELRMYTYGLLDDSTWPSGLFSAGGNGVEGRATIIDSEELDAGMRLIWSAANDTSNNAIFHMPPTAISSFYGGVCPNQFALYFAQSTAQPMASGFTGSSGHQVTYKPVYLSTN